MTYATDGKCHNAQLSTYGHECGKPATWIGTKDTDEGQFESGFCDDCKQHGYEARPYKAWRRVKPNIVIHVSGGIVQAVVSNDPGAVCKVLGDVVVIDYDNAPNGEACIVEVQKSTAANELRIRRIAVS